MTLSSTLKPLFNAGDRSRGASYHNRGSVHSIRVNDGLLVAEVDGSYGFYEVTLDVVDFDNERAISCTCPRFDGGFYCKHIWATILKYESVYGSHGSSRTKRVVNTITGQKKKASPRRIPKWQSVLQRISLDNWDTETRQTSPFETASGHATEIHYVIDVSEGSKYEPATIQLSVMNRSRKVNGEWGKLTSLELSHRTFDLVDSIDQGIAAYLMGADRKYYDTYGYRPAQSSFSKFEVDSNWSSELCELLLSSGRLHWTLGLTLPFEDFHALDYIDLKNPAEICIDIEEPVKSKKSAQMAVSIQRAGKRLDNHDIVKISKNGIVLLKNGLIKLSNPGAIELWQETLSGPPIQIALKDRSEFLSQLSDMRDLPSVTIPNSWKVQRPKMLTPNGVLRLHNVDHRDNEFPSRPQARRFTTKSQTVGQIEILKPNRSCYSS
jgi:hypothetical protein